jgi:hypothetical protein
MATRLVEPKLELDVCTSNSIELDSKIVEKPFRLHPKRRKPCDLHASIEREDAIRDTYDIMTSDQREVLRLLKMERAKHIIKLEYELASLLDIDRQVECVADDLMEDEREAARDELDRLNGAIDELLASCDSA